MRTLRIALAQINTTVGDLDGNTAKVLDYTARARDLGADLVAFPELAITGYPPEDLLFKHQFIEDNKARMRQVVEESDGITSIVGFVDSDADLHNAAAVAHDGSSPVFTTRCSRPTMAYSTRNATSKPDASVPCT